MTPDPVASNETDAEAGIRSSAAPARERWAHALHFASRWWLSAEWPVAWALLVALLAVELSTVYVLVHLNAWQQGFFDSIAQRRIAAFVPLLVLFAGLASAQVAAGVARTFVAKTLALRWRSWLTGRYLDRWLARNRYYEIERLRLIDNPDQRIAEDINLLSGGVFGTDGLPGIVVGYISALVGATSFIVILLRTSLWIEWQVLGLKLAIPGDLVVYGFLYVIAGSVVIVFLGRPYIRRTQRQQHREADFRAGLIHVRRNAAQIGFTGSTHVERRSLGIAFAGLRANYRRMVRSYLTLVAGQGLYQQIGSFLPLFILIPRYFAGRISFGQIMGARDAFGMLVLNLSYFITTYASLAQQIAYLNRLKGLDDALDRERPRGIRFEGGPLTDDVRIATHALRLHRPHGAPMAQIGDWRIRSGERWVVWGASGTGKSTLLRALIGLWPDGDGKVAFAGDGVAMFVPQRLYLPQGTLKDAVAFPTQAEMVEDRAILSLLDRVGLGEHGRDLHAIRLWQEDLSPGEQQRVALARILLHRPDLLILDEGTSALDHTNAAAFYRAIIEALPDLTLVSVVHDDRLVGFHTHRLSLEDGSARTAPIGTTQA